MSLSADVIYNIWCHHKMWYWVCKFPSTYSNMAPNVSPRICKSVGMYLDVCKIWYTIDDAMSFESFPSTYSNMTLNILLGYLDGPIFHTSIGCDYLVKVWQWWKKLRWKNLVKIGCTITVRATPIILSRDTTCRLYKKMCVDGYEIVDWWECENRIVGWRRLFSTQMMVRILREHN